MLQKLLLLLLLFLLQCNQVLVIFKTPKNLNLSLIHSSLRQRSSLITNNKRQKLNQEIMTSMSYFKTALIIHIKNMVPVNSLSPKYFLFFYFKNNDLEFDHSIISHSASRKGSPNPCSGIKTAEKFIAKWAVLVKFLPESWA